MAQIPSEIYLVFADARTNNNKFWSAIARNDGTLETTWGRIGYSGQTKTEGCGSYSRAITKLHILATTKKRKGYKESQPPKQLSSQLNIRRALQLLEEIKPYVQSRNFNASNYLEALNEYLTIVPTPLGMSINPATIYRNVAVVEHQIHLLQQLISPTVNSNRPSPLSDVQATSVPASLKRISNLFWKL